MTQVTMIKNTDQTAFLAAVNAFLNPIAVVKSVAYVPGAEITGVQGDPDNPIVVTPLHQAFIVYEQ